MIQQQKDNMIVMNYPPLSLNYPPSFPVSMYPTPSARQPNSIINWESGDHNKIDWLSATCLTAATIATT